MKTLLLFLAFAQVPSVQEELWREYDVYRDRLLQLAAKIPASAYDWRPAPKVRSTGEVILHVALNNYMLLDRMGEAVPADLFPKLPAAGPERPRAVFLRTLELEKEVTGKEKILALAARALADGGKPIEKSTPEERAKPAMFGNRKTSAGGLQVRAVAHLHEHLGQLIAYGRANGVAPPWSAE